MIFENINIFWFILSSIVLIMWSFFMYFFYKKRKNKWEMIIFSFSILCLIIAIFSPRLGLYEDTKQINGWNILFIVDLSKSMDVMDIQQWNDKISRLAAQKSIILDVVNQYNNNNYGLYWFSWESLELLPFTNDISLFKTIVNGIDKNNIWVYWSDFSKLFAWLKNYTDQIDSPSTFVILSDAWEIEDSALSNDLQNILKEKNIQVLFVWIGSEKWWKILDWVDFYWRPTYKMYEGEVVISKLNSQEIINISEKNNWDYIFLNRLEDSEKIWNKIIDGLVTSQIARNISSAKDISYIFIGLFLLLFWLFLCLEKYKINK